MALLIIELDRHEEIKEIPNKTKEQNSQFKSGENSETIKSNINIYIFSCIDILNLFIISKIHYFIFLRFVFHGLGYQSFITSFYLKNITLYNMLQISSKLIFLLVSLENIAHLKDTGISIYL